MKKKINNVENSSISAEMRNDFLVRKVGEK